MRSTLLTVALLWVFGVCLALNIEPRFRLNAAPTTQANDALSVLLGDSRRLIARQMYAKADAYFHSGYYPSIFDHHSEELHLSASPNHEGAHEDAGWLGPPQDWLDRFSRQFYPSEHRHLGESAEEHAAHDNHGEHHAEGGQEEKHSETGEESEILPWLRVSASLDPQRPQTYVVASYWLRTQLNKPQEAEQFLREGLRSNPGHPELLFELGRIFRENHHDLARARNIWEAALANWKKRSEAERDENRLLTAQLLGNLAKLEEEDGRFTPAIKYLQELFLISPNKEQIQSWISDLQTKQAAH